MDVVRAPEFGLEVGVDRVFMEGYLWKGTARLW